MTTPLTALSLCDRCGGSGRETETFTDGTGSHRIERPCDAGCRGTGRKTVTLAPEDPIHDRLTRATRYDFGAGDDSRFRTLRVELRAEGRWCVTDGHDVLANDGTWEYEPMPSNRDDEFIARTRFTLDKALAKAAALRAHPEHGKGGG